MNRDEIKLGLSEIHSGNFEEAVKIIDYFQRLHASQMKEVLERLKLKKCGKGYYKCDICPYKNECDISKFNKSIDEELEKLTQ